MEIASPHRPAPQPDPSMVLGKAVTRAADRLGFWRWRFLMDSPGLERIEPVARTAFCADIATPAIDLRQPPFDADALVWQHPSDNASTQCFARIAREAGAGGIMYRSVRDPEPGGCLALLTPAGFARPKPRPGQQTWFLAVSAQEVTWRRDRQALQFSTRCWRDSASAPA